MSTYMTAITGSIQLKSEVNEDALGKIKVFIDNTFADTTSLDKQGKIVHFNGSIDNSGELIEKFVSKLFPLIDTTNYTVIKAQGDDLKDHWDIVVEQDGVYVQEYVFVKDNKRKYY